MLSQSFQNSKILGRFFEQLYSVTVDKSPCEEEGSEDEEKEKED